MIFRHFRPQSWSNIAWRNVDSGPVASEGWGLFAKHEFNIRKWFMYMMYIYVYVPRDLHMSMWTDKWIFEFLYPSITSLPSFNVWWLLSGLWHSGASWAHPASHHIFQSSDFDPPAFQGVAFSWQRLLVFHLKWWWALWWFLVAWWCSSGWRLGDTWPHKSLWQRVKIFQLKR